MTQVVLAVKEHVLFLLQRIFDYLHGIIFVRDCPITKIKYTKVYRRFLNTPTYLNYFSSKSIKIGENEAKEL